MDPAQAGARWQLVLVHQQTLIRIARGRGLGDEDARDCVQEAMLRCVEFPRLDETRVLQFLVTTTVRLCADHGRDRARNQRLATKLAGLRHSEASPEELACDRAEAQWISDRLGELPEWHRRVLAAKADGLTCAEIAAQLQVSFKTIESQLSRVRSRARAMLAATTALLVAAVRRSQPSARTAAVASLTTAVSFSLLIGRTPVPQPAPPAPPESRPWQVRPAGRTPELAPAPAPASDRAVPHVVPPPSGSPAVDPTRSPRPDYSPSCPVMGPGVCTNPTPTTTPGPVERLLYCVHHGIDWSNGFDCRRPPSPTGKGTP